ncbi:MAG: alpha/beta hydrolase family protein [Clostridia bacterium]|nr:alpha/beta hydrolase family protein [Clostridia bacterium]HXK72775.1 alpha/beta hydrolase family protein [Clostridia bacterium]
MAVITLNFRSIALKMSTTVTVVLPDSVRIGDTPISERKCLYLLHGLSDDSSSCLRLSKIELYAQEAGIVIIMPSAGRSMYCDNIYGQNYFSYIAHELPEYMNLVFGIKADKDKIFIAGISMGGLGASRIALSYPERFSAVGLFSGLLNLKYMLPVMTDEQKNDFSFMLSEVKDIDTSPLNPVNLLDAKKHANLKFYIYCGKQDDLFPLSISFIEKARTLGLKVISCIEDGIHDWYFWDKHLKTFIEDISQNKDE